MIGKGVILVTYIFKCEELSSHGGLGMKIGLVSCSKKKKNFTAKPKVLYENSPLFRKVRKFCELFHEDWYILSAKHNVLSPDGSQVEPYDESLRDKDRKERERWAEITFQELKKLGVLSQTLVIHAGKNYYEDLLPLLDRGDVEYEVPTNGLRYGEKMAWYKKKIENINMTETNFRFKRATRKVTS